MILQKIKELKGEDILKAGIFIYFIGFIFLFFVGKDYTGLFSFLAPFSIVLGIIVISLGLVK